MNALNARFKFTVTDTGKTLSLCQGDDIRIYPAQRNRSFGEDLTERQIDLIRIATAVHVADAWARRKATFNFLRNPNVQIEVLDAEFWSKPDTMDLLKSCVDFVSGEDDWEFSFIASKNVRHDRRSNLFPKHDQNALVSLYSGGLDSSSGLALRAAAQPGRMIVPVTIRHQMQKSKLLRSHFKLLMDRGILKPADFNPFQAGAFIRNRRIKREYREEFREITHRCRPFLFMSVAGLVANSFSAPEVEVFESGVGSINLPLVGGPADYHTTRSTHPNFLRLISALVSHVNGATVRYVLPFADKTKAEMVCLIKAMGLEELARKSVSCILHPLKRKGWRQCGRCAACIFRRQAMLTAGIAEDKNAYATDLFTETSPEHTIPPNDMRWVMAFHEQVASLGELDSGIVPSCFRRYLKTTKAASTEEQLAPHAEVYRRYRREWMLLIANARRRSFPWITSSRSSAAVEGATS
jgi:7-cyano-7-deazaguanine synthase in queuosine biosynthesis